MPRMVDADCKVCDYKIRDQYMSEVPDVLYHDDGESIKHQMEYVYIPRSRERTVWSEGESIVVFRDPSTDQIKYPGRNDVATPSGYERVVMRSDKEVAAFEKRYNVRSERRWFDNGSGTKRFDEQDREQPSEESRLRKFMESWR